jgi:hypothetical protein
MTSFFFFYSDDAYLLEQERFPGHYVGARYSASLIVPHERDYTEIIIYKRKET